MKKIKSYYSTHISVSFVTLLVCLFFLFAFVFLGYLRKVYFSYLIEQTYETENNIILYVKEDLNRIIKELIYQGCRSSVDNRIYQIAVKIENEEGSEKLNDSLALSSILKREINAGSANVSAIVSPDGLIGQYDRWTTTSKKSSALWSAGNTRDLCQMAAVMVGEQIPPGKRSLPRVWVYTEPSLHPSGRDEGVFHIVLPLTGGVVSVWNTRLALVSTYSSDLITERLRSINLRRVDYVEGYISDSAGQRLYTGASTPRARDSSAWGSAQEKTDDTRLLTADLDYFDWKLNVVINENAIWGYVSFLFYRTVLIGSAIMLLLIVLILLMFRQMMRPVRLLLDSMKEAEKGRLNGSVKIEGQHEIWQVAEEYNRMIGVLEEKNEEIDRQHRQTLRFIRQQHAAEWDALESQINAHFICNTLGCINYEAMEAGNHEVSQMLKKLSNILRYTFDQKRQEVMLCQETAWVDQYLYLQKMRREDLFDYEISFPEVYGQWPCCKLMFQPFVENSIIHGFEGMEKGGMIRILIDMDGERLRVRIEDNGCGMKRATALLIREILDHRDSSGSSLEPDPAGGPLTGSEPFDIGETEREGRMGVGIRNVVTRMRMFFGPRFEAELWTEEGKGTSFTFRLPIPDFEEDFGG